MADTSISITAGSGTAVDTRTESTNGNHRQVVVLGDPATNAGVAPVDATNGLAVNVPNVTGTTGAAGPASAVSVAGTDGSGNLREITTETDGSVHVVIKGVDSGATELTKLTNAAYADGDMGVGVWAVRDDALTTLTPADGDYVPLRVRLHRGTVGY